MRASSTAIARVAVIIHPLEALYQLRLGRGDTPAVEAMFRIQPVRRRLHRRHESARRQIDGLVVHRHHPVELILVTVLQRAGLMRDAGIVHQDIKPAEMLAATSAISATEAASATSARQAHGTDFAGDRGGGIAIDIRQKKLRALGRKASRYRHRIPTRPRSQALSCHPKPSIVIMISAAAI